MTDRFYKSRRLDFEFFIGLRLVKEEFLDGETLAVTLESISRIALEFMVLSVTLESISRFAFEFICLSGEH